MNTQLTTTPRPTSTADWLNGDPDARADVVALLDALAAPTCASTVPAPAASQQAQKARLLARAHRAIARGAGFITHRGHAALRALESTPAPGVTLRVLHAAANGGTALRAGEPELAVLVELAPGCHWACGLASVDSHCEWLVMNGQPEIDGHALHTLDFLRQPGGPTTLRSSTGARMYLRISPIGSTPLACADSPAATTFVQHDAPALWLPFAPRIVRRLLHSDGRQAAMLYRTEPLAQVPHHGHGHDEECLMLEGELFLDDVLLGPGEFQLAPAGSEHHEVFTDTGCLLYAHGDVELALR